MPNSLSEQRMGLGRAERIALFPLRMQGAMLREVPFSPDGRWVLVRTAEHGTAVYPGPAEALL